MMFQPLNKDCTQVNAYLLHESSRNVPSPFSWTSPSLLATSTENKGQEVSSNSVPQRGKNRSPKPNFKKGNHLKRPMLKKLTLRLLRDVYKN